MKAPFAQPLRGTSAAGRLPIFVVLAILALLAGVVFHGLLLEAGIRKALDIVGRKYGFDVAVDSIHARIGSPVTFKNLQLRSPRTPQTTLSFEETEIQWNWLSAMLGREGRMIKSLAARNGRILLDVRKGQTPPHGTSMRRLTREASQKEAHAFLRWLPLRIMLDGLTVEEISYNGRFSIRGIRADFDEAALGAFHAEGMEIQLGDALQVFASQRAVTAWKNGEAFLSNMALRVGMTVENFSLQLARPGGVGFDIQAALFGGSLRGGAFFGEWRGEPGMDAVFWGSRMDLGELCKFLGFQANAAGILSEGRITFRGNPDRLLDGEASLRIAAEDFRLGNRGWKTLDVGASLINRRLSLEELKLQQKENLVVANGEAALSGDWRDMTTAPFLLNLSAEIRDMTSLGALLGPPFNELNGRMTATAMLSGRAKKMDGFASLEASGMGMRGRRIESAKLDASFAGGEVRINRLEAWSGGDSLSGQGAIALAAPHAYSGQISAKIQDFAAYARLFPSSLPVTKGHLRANWQGDGTFNAHSGAFQIFGENFVSQWTPEGLTGRAAGTYSPLNFYFGDITLESGRTALSTRLTLAESGIRVDDLVIRRSGKMAASGEMFLPLDIFRLLHGEEFFKALLPGKPLHLRFQTLENLPLETLMQLAGQTPAGKAGLEGRAVAAGSTSHPEMDVQLSLRGMKFSGHDIPESDARISWKTAQDILRVSGKWASQGFQAAHFDVQAPLGIPSDERPTLLDPEGILTGSLEMPGSSLALLRLFLPVLHEAAGTMSGQIGFAGKLSHPEIRGRLEIQNGTLTLGATGPELKQLDGVLNFDGEAMRIESFGGKSGPGDFTLTGFVGFADPSKLDVHLKLEGSRLPLLSEPAARALADVSMDAAGRSAEGALTGSLRLVEGRILQDIEVFPLLPGESTKAFPQAPALKGLVPPPWNTWTLNASLTNTTPLPLQDHPASGTITTDLRLAGTLGDPLLLGTLRLKNGSALFPAATLTIPEGVISFTEAAPWMPILDIAGKTTAGSDTRYEIHLTANGPLSTGKLILHSTPPLRQEQMVRLLTTGKPHGGVVTGGISFSQISTPTIFPYFRSPVSRLSPFGPENGRGSYANPPLEEGVAFRVQFRKK